MEAVEVSPVFHACCLSWKASKRANQVVPAGLAASKGIRTSENDIRAPGETASLARFKVVEAANADMQGGEASGGELSSREATLCKNLIFADGERSMIEAALGSESKVESGSVKDNEQEQEFHKATTSSSWDFIQGVSRSDDQTRTFVGSPTTRWQGGGEKNGVKSRGPATVCTQCAATTGALDTMRKYWQEAEQRAREAEATARAMENKESKLVAQLCSLLKQVELRQVQLDHLSGLVANQQADFMALEGRYISHLLTEQGLRETDVDTHAPSNGEGDATWKKGSLGDLRAEVQSLERQKCDATRDGEQVIGMGIMLVGANAFGMTRSDKAGLREPIREAGAVPRLKTTLEINGSENLTGVEMAGTCQEKPSEGWAVARTESRTESQCLESESSFKFDASPVAVEEAAREESDRLLKPRESPGAPEEAAREGSDRLRKPRESTGALEEAAREKSVRLLKPRESPGAFEEAAIDGSDRLLEQRRDTEIKTRDVEGEPLDAELQKGPLEAGRMKLHGERIHAELLVEDLVETDTSHLSGNTSPSFEGADSSFGQQQSANLPDEDFERGVLVEAFALDERVGFSEHADWQQTSQGLDVYAAAWASNRSKLKADMAWGEPDEKCDKLKCDLVEKLDLSSLPSPHSGRTFPGHVPQETSHVPRENASTSAFPSHVPQVASHLPEENDLTSAARLLESRGKLTRRDSLPRRREGFAALGGEDLLVPHPPTTAAPRRKASTRERHLAESGGRISDKENGPSHVPTLTLRLQDLKVKQDENRSRNASMEFAKKESEMSAPEPPPQPRAAVIRPQFRVLRPKVN